MSCCSAPVPNAVVWNNGRGTKSNERCHCAILTVVVILAFAVVKPNTRFQETNIDSDCDNDTIPTFDSDAGSEKIFVKTQ